MTRGARENAEGKITPVTAGEWRAEGASAGHVQLGAEGHGRERLALPDVRRLSSCDCTAGHVLGSFCCLKICSWQSLNVNRQRNPKAELALATDRSFRLPRWQTRRLRMRRDSFALRW